jgi:transcriptional regulator with XRE-family HTH domain
MTSFGEFFKQKRLSLGKTLREFCQEHGLDPGNISKIERGKMSPPIDKLEEYALYLSIKDEEYETFKDLAFASAGKIPDDLKDEETLARLPIFFRTLRNREFSEDKLRELARKIAES